MEENLPSLITQTKLDNHTISDVKVEARITVKYVFETKVSKDLSIPYAVAIDGIALEIYKNKPKRVNGKKGQIVIPNVKPGSNVSLYLNSDAHPSYRKNPVYMIKVGQTDVVVIISEKRGKLNATEVPTLVESQSSSETRNDLYTALLTGDIWMMISHRYSSSEVGPLLPKNVIPDIQRAVEAIYNRLATPLLELSVEGKKLIINFEDSDNAKANISRGYTLLGEGLTRVHPAGYAALFAAALEANVDRITVTSCWRPMLGSIAHRAGLGIDVNYLENTRLNRAELREEKAIDTANVSEDEKLLFSKFEQAKAEQASAHEQYRKAIKSSKNNAEISEENEAIKKAKDRVANADRQRNIAETAWNNERNKNEPSKVRTFRQSLMKQAAVSQIFDPWYMDANSKDKNVPLPNMQITQNEKTYLLRHMGKFIKRTGTDENYVERTELIKVDSELAERLLSAGEAWDVSVEVSVIYDMKLDDETCSPFPGKQSG